MSDFTAMAIWVVWKSSGRARPLTRLSGAKAVISNTARLLQGSHLNEALHDKQVPSCFHGNSSHHTGELSGDLWWHVSERACVHCFCLSEHPCVGDALITAKVK